MKKARFIIFSVICIVIAVFMLITGCITEQKNENEDIKEKTESKTVNIKSINKHGNIIIDATFEEMKEINIEVGDIITVAVGENTYDMPVGNSYSDVDSGSMICRFDIEDNEIGVAINMGAFASTVGIGEKQSIEEDPGYRWNMIISEVTLTLKTKGGYKNDLLVRGLTRTNERSDYASLSDEDFANFRAVKVSGMKDKIIYRSSTPIEPAIGRNTYAMQATEAAGIKSIINLDDDYETMIGYETYAQSYYSGCKITNIALTYDFTSEDFKLKLKDCVTFLIENEGPFLIHCKEGKDRTGIVCAILESLVGGTYEEIVDDYMLTYFNYYNVEKNSETYEIILKTNLIKTLCELYDVSDLGKCDLVSEAKEFLKSTGLSEEEITSLENMLKA